jgi:hypothetical protein
LLGHGYLGRFAGGIWSPLFSAVVGSGEVFGQLHTIQVAERLGDMGDLADLGLDEHVGAQHCADLLGVRPRHRPDLADGSPAVDDAQESPSCR